MMLRMLVNVAGLDFNLNPGDVTNRFDEAESLRLIAKGAAVLADEIPLMEKAVKVNHRREKRSKKVKP